MPAMVFVHLDIRLNFHLLESLSLALVASTMNHTSYRALPWAPKRHQRTKPYEGHTRAKSKKKKEQQKHFCATLMMEGSWSMSACVLEITQNHSVHFNVHNITSQVLNIFCSFIFNLSTKFVRLLHKNSAACELSQKLKTISETMQNSGNQNLAII